MKRTAKKLLGLLLAVVLVAGMLPVGTVALAAEVGDAITFEMNPSASGYTALDIDTVYKSYGAAGAFNEDWMYFDTSDEVKALEHESITARRDDDKYRNLHHLYDGVLNISSYRKANTPIIEKDTDVWAAFKVKAPLDAGVYKLSVSTAANNKAWQQPASLEMYVAEYDSAKADGDAYITDANRVYTKTLTSVDTGSGTLILDDNATVDSSTFNVFGGSEEYIVLFRVTNCNLNIKSFSLTKTADLPTSVTATMNPSTSGYTTLDIDSVYKAYGAEGSFNENWVYFDVSDEVKALGHTTTSERRAERKYQTLNALYGGDLNIWAYREANSASIAKDTDVWTAFKVKAPLAAGTYKLSVSTAANNKAWQQPASLEMYVAEYDSAKTDGDAYITDANCVFEKSLNSVDTGSGTLILDDNATVDSSTFNVYGGAEEYIVLFRVTNCNITVKSFSLTKTADLSSDVTVTMNPSTSGYTTLDIDSVYKTYGLAGAFNENWMFFDASDEIKALGHATTSERRTERKHQTLNSVYDSELNIWSYREQHNPSIAKDADVWTAFKVRAPLTAGIYKLNVSTGKNSKAFEEPATIRMYVAPYDSAKTDGDDYISDANLVYTKTMNSVDTGSGTAMFADNSIIETDTFALPGGSDEYIVLFSATNCNLTLKSFTLEKVSALPASGAELVLSSDSIRIGESTTPSLVIGEAKVLGATYTSSPETTARVLASGDIFAIKAGTATITGTSGDITASKELTVVPEEVLSDNVSVAIYSLVDGVSGGEGIEASPAIAIGDVASVARRKSITLEATGIEGKEFKYWQLASGVILSEEESYTFNANSNTAIFGVYESEEDAADGADVTIRFFNGFGSFIQKVVKAKGTLFSEFASAVTDKDYRGYAFESWMNADDSITDDTPINKNDVVVAQYAETPAETYTVTGIVNPGDYAYDAVVTAESTDADFSYWTRNDDIVSYNPTYTFSVWGDTNVAAVCDGAKTAVPTVILDNDGSVYMTEYSLPAGYTFIEAGIVFSNSGTPSINSCTSKASSKKLSGLHGQFAARPASSETVARGYVVYIAPNGQLIATYSK